MTLDQINNYAKEFYKQIKSTHKHLASHDIHLICGWMGVAYLRNLGITGGMHYAISSTGEQIYSLLLNEEEFKEYETYKRKAIDERARRKASEKEATITTETSSHVTTSGTDYNRDAITEASDSDPMC